MQESVLIVGAGSGLSASLARLCNSKGMKVVLAARDIEKLKQLKKEIKEKCSHNKITHYIQPGWERSEHSYTCQICGFDLYSDEYDYRNIKKVVDM